MAGFGKVMIRAALRWLLAAILSAISSGGCTAQEKIGDPASVVTDWIEALPTRPLLYVIVAALAGFYAWCRWCQWQSRYGRAGDGGPAYLQTNQDTIVKLLRRRAFTLETWAHLMLAGVIAVLLGGLYFIIYVLQQVVSVSDVETARRIEFDDRFGVTLDRIVKGRYWLKVAEVPALEGQGRAVAAFFADRGTTPAVYKGVVARDRGPVFVTDDGGRTWGPAEFEQKHRKGGEVLVAGAFAKDGSRGVLFGSLGTIWSTDDEGRTWSSVEPYKSTRPALLGLPETAGDVTEAVITNSLVVAKTELGSTFVRVDPDNTSSSRQGRWQELTNLHLPVRARPQALALNGDAGIIALDPSLTFTTLDDGVTWTPSEFTWPSGEIVTISRENGNIVVITTSGKQLTWNEEDKEWSEAAHPANGNGSPRPAEEEHWVGRLFRNDKLTLLVGSTGTVKKRKSGRWTTLVSGTLKQDEAAIVGVAFSGEDNVVLIARDGMYYQPQNGSLGSPKPIANSIKELEHGGWEQDGELRVLVDSEKKLYTWAESRWNESDAPVTLNGGIILVKFNGSKGRLVSSTGTVFTTTDEGMNWEESVQLRLDEEKIEGGAFCTDNQGVFVTGEGSVWKFDESGDAVWTRAELPFVPGETFGWANEPAFSVDGRYGLVVADWGSSVTFTRDCGHTWTTPPPVALSYGMWVISNDSGETNVLTGRYREQSTFWHNPDARFVTASGSPYERLFAGVTDKGDIYLLRERPDLGSWRTRSAHDILTSVGGIDVERDMEAFISARSDSDGKGAPAQHPIMDSVHFRLMVARGTALIFLLFLLNLLVGVQRYTLRLSAFWSSRADAIMLHPIMTGAPSVDFDALVKSLAPDTYDFGPAPGSLLGKMLRGRL